MAEKGLPLPKFGEWDVNDPASAEGFTVIFNKARNEKRTGGKADSPQKTTPHSSIEQLLESLHLILKVQERITRLAMPRDVFQKTGAAVKL